MEEQVITFRIYKNKIFLLIFVLLHIFSCSLTNKDVNNENVNNIDFQPDTTINRKLVLRNEKSLINFFNGKVDLILDSKELAFPAIFFTNKSKTQYLIAYHYHGDLKNQFSLFEVGYYDESLKGIKMAQTEYKLFMTESKIMLGMKKEEIIRKKGSNYITTENQNIESLRYVLSDYQNSTLLKKYNLPLYYSEYNFKDGNLIRFTFGFEYP